MSLFTYWDNGSWENEINNVESKSGYDLQKSNDFAFDGSFSGKITNKGGGNIFDLNLDIASNKNLAPRFLPFLQNTDYRVRFRVYTPSSSPIGIGQVQMWLFATGSGTTGAQVIDVVDFTDQWVEFDWVFPSGNSVNSIDVRIGFNSFGGDDPIVGGLVYIDDVSIVEDGACDLEFDTPETTKTNETVDLANDGTITVNATSSFTIEYSLDNITWQLSNLFENLAPGTYTPFIRDSNPEGCTFIGVDVIIQPGTFIPPPPVPGGVLTIDKKPINDNNFLTWFEASGNTGFSSMVCSNQCWDIPNAYLNNKVQQPHYPIITPTETTSFYLNFNTLFDNPNHADFRLGMINAEGLQESDISDLNFLFEEDGTSYDIWCDVNIPSTQNGIYRFVIYNSNDNSTLFVSQEVELINSGYECVSTYIQFRNSLNLKGFRYQSLVNFIQQFRMRLYQIEEQTEESVSNYRSVSSGLLRNVHYDLDRYIVLEAYYFDKFGHRAMSTFQVHDTMFVNGVNYLLKSGYKSEVNALRNVNKGTVELYEQAFSSSDKYGVPIDLVVVGSDDDLLLGNNGGFIKL